MRTNLVYMMNPIHLIKPAVLTGPAQLPIPVPGSAAEVPTGSTKSSMARAGAVPHPLNGAERLDLLRGGSEAQRYRIERPIILAVFPPGEDRTSLDNRPTLVWLP
jgi:hypothetical protein